MSRDLPYRLLRAHVIEAIRNQPPHLHLPIVEVLVDLWRRYLPTSATDGTSATPLARHVADVPLVAEQGGVPVLCTVCGETMTVYEVGQTTHPSCQEPAA